jgi:tripartite-type tricarboxylate transporter receptor subunit TctC
MVHVAYKGSAAYANDLIGGQIPAAIDTVADLSELHKAGRVRIVATSGAQRSPVVPEVPTLTELGFRNLETGGWFGFFANVNTPPAIVQALNRHLNQALRHPDVVAKLKSVGMDPATSTPDELQKRLAADHARWGAVVKATGFTSD